MKKNLIILFSSIAILVLSGLIIVGFGSYKNGEVVKVKSGLITQDALNNGKLTFTSAALGEKKPIIASGEQGIPQWIYYGSAVPRKSPVSVFEDATGGLHIGVKSGSPNSWAGFFAMSNDDYSTVYHTVINMPYRTINEGSFSAGMYIQTSVIYPHINYVACVAEVSEDGIKWSVESGTGNASDVNDRHLLWSDDDPSLPMKRDCTIVTDGESKLKVYYDERLVYSGSNLNLQMPRPFNSYLEVQTTNSKDLLYGIFSHYYSSLEEDIKVINAPKEGSVALAIGDNKSLVKARTNIEGIASLPVASFNSPIKGSILVYDRNGDLFARTDKPINVSGGDIFSAARVIPIQKWLLNQ
jgi:hypothetical protein